MSKTCSVRNFSALAFCVAVGMIAAGCSKDGGSNGGGVGSGSLQGQWTSSCADASGPGITEQTQLSMNDGQWTETRYASNSGDCAPESRMIEFISGGTFVDKGAAGDGLSKIERTTTSFKVKPLTAFGAKVLEVANWCGHSDWKEGVEVDVTAEAGKHPAQSGVNVCAPNKAPSTLSTVYSFEGPRLYFGASSELSSNSRRASTTLNRDVYYTR